MSVKVAAEAAAAAAAAFSRQYILGTSLT